MSGSPEVVIEGGHLPGAANVLGGNEISKRIADGVEGGVEDGAAGSVAVGDVGILPGILRAEKGHGGGAVGFDQGEEFPINIEAEVGVKRLSGHDSVFAGCVDEEISIGRNSDVGEGPLGEIGGVVSEVVSIDRGCRSGIVNFDPVGGESVFIVEGGAGVFGEEFVD